MVVKADQQKIKALLKDTITLLCKNGLNYSTEFCVEALIGITLDKDDVMLVSINETVKSVTASGEGLEMEEIIVESDDKVSSTRPKAYHHMHHSTPHHSTPHHSTPQRKRSMKVEPPQDTGGGEDDGDNSSLGGFQDESSSEPPLARKMKRPKVEQDDDYNDDDAVVIKEEMEDWASASNSASIFGDISGGQPSGQQGDDVDLQHVLQSGSLVPVSSMQGGTNTAMWQGQAGGIRTSTVTSDLTQGDTQDQQQMMSLSRLPVVPLTKRDDNGTTSKWPWECQKMLNMESSHDLASAIPLVPGSNVMILPAFENRLDKCDNAPRLIKELMGIYFTREQLALGSFLGTGNYRPLDKDITDAIVVRAKQIFGFGLRMPIVSKSINDKCHHARRYFRLREAMNTSALVKSGTLDQTASLNERNLNDSFI